MAITTTYLITTTLQGIVVLARPSYVPFPWHTLLIMWAAILFAVMVNLTTGRFLSKLEVLILIFHLAGFLGILVPLVSLSPHNDPSVVFTTFLDNGGWGSEGLIFFVGLPSIASTLIGADCAVHMSEEIQSAATVVPQAMLYTIFINGSLAFAMTIALMFCLTDIDAAVMAADTMFYPFLEVFRSGVNSTAGAVVMASVVLILATASSVGVYASASRMIWSFARDRGLPFSGHLAKVINSHPFHFWGNTDYRLSISLLRGHLYQSMQSFYDGDLKPDFTDRAWVFCSAVSPPVSNCGSSILVLPASVWAVLMATVDWWLSKC
ncbi:hypothetical protein M426DRAFT_11376 [Hypoxylon sp. CI-4A]|nr:hypothetical protein M426DRAFT_11376 [Hypoxylon sp. CI-4A]